MLLKEAKCTECNGVLSVDESKDAMLCPYCGNAIVIEKAIKNFSLNYTSTSKKIPNNSGNKSNSSVDFDIRDGVLVKYNGRKSRVVVPEGVIEIEREAINGASEIIFPKSLKIIRFAAINDFRGEKIEFPDNIEILEGLAIFPERPDNLKYVKMPKSYIGYYDSNGTSFNFGLEACYKLEEIKANPELLSRIADSYHCTVSYDIDFTDSPIFSRIPEVIERNKKIENMSLWRSSGLCIDCGGKISFFNGKCVLCGQPKRNERGRLR